MYLEPSQIAKVREIAEKVYSQRRSELKIDKEIFIEFSINLVGIFYKMINGKTPNPPEMEALVNSLGLSVLHICSAIPSYVLLNERGFSIGSTDLVENLFLILHPFSLYKLCEKGWGKDEGWKPIGNRLEEILNILSEEGVEVIPAIFVGAAPGRRPGYLPLCFVKKGSESERYILSKLGFIKLQDYLEAHEEAEPAKFLGPRILRKDIPYNSYLPRSLGDWIDLLFSFARHVSVLGEDAVEAIFVVFYESLEKIYPSAKEKISAPYT